MNPKRIEMLHGLAVLLECGGERVVPEAVLDELGPWDSLAVMSTVVMIDEIHGRVVHGRQLAQCVTVADVLKIAEGG